MKETSFVHELDGGSTILRTDINLLIPGTKRQAFMECYVQLSSGCPPVSLSHAEMHRQVFCFVFFGKS